MDNRTGGRGRARTWALVVAAVACLPVLGVFTTTRIFFVRDLSLFFWSRHVWLRHTIAGGEAPWWDPYVAGGQSAIADALNQLLMPVTLAIRLMPSAVVSFNLWIALPLPLAGLGMFLFLRRLRAADGGYGFAAAAFGACVFALSGPVVSMLNTPNLSWSVALLPWVMVATARVLETRSARTVAVLGVVFALQALCGEPVTWASTAVVAATFALFRPQVLAGLVAGALLAAAQLVPTVMAGLRAQRGPLATPDFWSVHPVALWETLAPHLFGNYYDAFLAALPWMGALNFGRDPFLYSLYIGPLVLVLAIAGVVARFRRGAFWTAIALVFLVAALGGYTPLYPLARRLFPPLMYFRFPTKYILLSVFACAVLAAEGFAAVLNRGGPSPSGNRPRESGSHGVAWAGASVAAAGLLLSLFLLLVPDVVTSAALGLATSVHLKDPAAGAVFLAQIAPSLAARAFGLLLAGCALAIVAGRAAAAGRQRQAIAAAAALFIATCADLLAANAGLNLTTEVAKLTPPGWYTASAGPQRMYVGGRVRGFMNPDDPDATSTWQIPAALTAVEGRMELNAELPMAPSGWRVREALSYDLPYLWPAAYDATVRQFEDANADERAAFLRRTGVRRCVLPMTERRQWRVVADVPDWNMRVFECDPGATRVFVASSVKIAPDPSDLDWQRRALFDPALPDEAVRLDVMPPLSGRPGPTDLPFTRIVEDGATTVTVEVSVPVAGTFVLRDSFDPSWTVAVDGVPGVIARANGLYRAVALPPGRHVIRFSYRPRDLATGLMISGMTALLLMGSLAISSRRRRAGRTDGAAPRDAGFTLIELMIVLAIIAVLLALAFSQYRGMQARGNDVSALASMRSITAAQWQFALTCGNMKYASTLAALAQPVPSTGHGFLSPDLTGPDGFEKSGFTFHLAAKPVESGAPACNGTVPAEGYAATADPVRPGATGTIFYGVNADRILYVDEQQTFTGNLPESGAPPHGAEVK